MVFFWVLLLDALPEVSVAYVSTAEVWVDSAVDWTLYGLNKAGCRERVHLPPLEKEKQLQHL